MLDRNSLSASGYIITSLGSLRRRAGDEACGRSSVLLVNEVVNVHRLRRGNVLFRVLAQLGNAAGSVLGGIT